MSSPTTRTRTLPQAWVLSALLGGYPLWWFLGIDAFVWIIAAAPMLLHLLVRKDVRAPRGFGAWLLFLMFVLASFTQVGRGNSGIMFAYRFLLYAAATVIFLYVYNLPRGDGAHRVARALTWLWGVVAVGGILGVLLPSFTLHSPIERVVPSGLLANEWIHDLVHLRFAQVQDFLGYPISRPSAPFPYTNSWGSAFALLVPFAALSMQRRRALHGHWMMRVLLLVSVVPVVLSVNRGLWLSLALATTYVLIRFALRGRARALAGIGLAAVFIAVMVVTTPLGQVIGDRLDNPHSDEGRLSLYGQSIESASRSPLLGFGVPRPPEDNPNLPPVGTHGMLWMVLVSHGLPATVLFVGWLGWTTWCTRRRNDPLGFWANVSLFITLVQLPYYGLLPAQIQLVMIAAALAWRPSALQPPQPERRRAAEASR